MSKMADLDLDRKDEIIKYHKVTDTLITVIIMLIMLSIGLLIGNNEIVKLEEKNKQLLYEIDTLKETIYINKIYNK